MTKNSMIAILTAIQNIDFEGKDTVIEELNKELNRGAAEKAAKSALYDAAKEVIFETLRAASSPVTASELFESCAKRLPDGFSKAQVQYGLVHQWADDVIKTTGKVNTYSLKV